MRNPIEYDSKDWWIPVGLVLWFLQVPGVVVGIVLTYLIMK